MTLKFAPWRGEPLFEWDDANEAEIWKHKVDVFEVLQCFKNQYTVRPHNRARSEPEKYGDRYFVQGRTNGGRKLLIVVQHKGDNQVRVITALDL